MQLTERIRLILVNTQGWLLAMVALVANCLVKLGAVTDRDGWSSTDSKLQRNIKN